MSTLKYYDVWDDRESTDRWHLKRPFDKNGSPLDPWQFKAGRILAFERPPVFRISHPGRPLEFTLSGFTLPVVHGRVVSILERLDLRDQVQFVPARIVDVPEPYYILNALKIIRCIDDARCQEVRRWGPDDGEPERVGEYRNVVGMRVDPTRIGVADVLRPWGWEVALLVSERVKLALETERVTGPRFTEA